MRHLLALFMVGIAGIASAQAPSTRGMRDAPEDPRIAALLAQAAKPGDEALTCDQLEAEIAAIGTDPQVQAVIREQGGYAQEQMAKMQGAQQPSGTAVPARPSVAGQMFTGFLTGFVPPNPVTGHAQQAAAAAQNARVSAEAQKNMQDMMANAQKMMRIMPKMTRGAHVVKLAEAKGCDFVGGDRAGAAEPAAEVQR